MSWARSGPGVADRTSRALSGRRPGPSLSRFPCKPRVTNTVNLSQGESSGEEDDQRVQCRFPAVSSSSRFPSSLAGNVAQSEVEQLHRGLVRREMPASLGDFPQLEVDGSRSSCTRYGAVLRGSPGTE